MAELTWTAEAERWLRDIHDFIAQDNPAAAIRTIETLYQKAEILREFPESGYRYGQRDGGSLANLLCSRNARPQKDGKGAAGPSFLLAERARSECARPMRAVKDSPATPFGGSVISQRRQQEALLGMCA